MVIGMDLSAFVYMLTFSCAAPFVEYAFFFPFYIFSFFVKNQLLIGVWIDIQIFNSIPLVLLSAFMPIQNCFHYCSSIVEFEVRDCDVSRSSFVVQDCFGYPEFFVFPYKVGYCPLEV